MLLHSFKGCFWISKRALRYGDQKDTGATFHTSRIVRPILLAMNRTGDLKPDDDREVEDTIMAELGTRGWSRSMTRQRNLSK